MERLYFLLLYSFRLKKFVLTESRGNAESKSTRISDQPSKCKTLQVFTLANAQKLVKTMRDPKDRNVKYITSRSPAGFWTASTTLGGHRYQAHGSTDERAMKRSAEIILHDMICRQDPLLQRLQYFKSVNFESTSSSCLSNTRFQFTAYYL